MRKHQICDHGFVASVGGHGNSRESLAVDMRVPMSHTGQRAILIKAGLQVWLLLQIGAHLFCELETNKQTKKKIDSRLLCNAMGHPGWTKIPITTFLECIFELFLLKKQKHNPVENSCIVKKVKFVLKTIHK